MDGFKREESIATYAINWKISADGNYFEIIDDVEEVLAVFWWRWPAPFVWNSPLAASKNSSPAPNESSQP